MESDISASRYNLANQYIRFLHFVVGYHLPVYLKEAMYRLTDKSFRKGDISGSRYIFWAGYLFFPLI